jgi:hypothetical protein
MTTLLSSMPWLDLAPPPHPHRQKTQPLWLNPVPLSRSLSAIVLYCIWKNMERWDGSQVEWKSMIFFTYSCPTSNLQKCVSFLLLTLWICKARICKSIPRKFSSVPPVTLSYFPFSRPCLTSCVSCLTSLYLAYHPMSPDMPLCSLSFVLSPLSRLCSLPPVRCTQSYVSVPCLPSAVLSLTPLFLVSSPLSLFLVSRPLSSVFRLCSLSPVRCPQSFVSVPCLLSPVFRLCSLSPVRSLTSLFLVSCPQSYVSVPCLPSAVLSLTSLFLVSCLQSYDSVPCHWSSLPCLT